MIGLARVISTRGMKAFDLQLTEDGRIINRLRHGVTYRTPEAETVAILDIGGEQVQVEYTPSYFPAACKDLFAFVAPEVDGHRRPNRLSNTGYLSHFAPSDAVAAYGGPAAYARLYAEARLRGREAEEAFIATFEEKPPEVIKPPRKKAIKPESSPATAEPPAPTEIPLPGEHAAKIMEERKSAVSTSEPPRQGTLF